MGAARAEAREFVEPDPYRPDPEGLRAWLIALLGRGDILAAAAWVVQFIARLWAIQGQLRARAEQSKRRKSPSERMRALQAELPGLFDAPAANDGANKERGEPPPKRKAKRGPRKRNEHGRPNLPEHLPRKVRTIFVPAAERRCPCCAEEMTGAGVERSERLERVPAHYVVEVTEREVLRCARCAGSKVIAPAPDAVVDRGILGEDLLIGAAVDHYRDAVPFERMARGARAQGVPLAANTLARGVGKLVDLLDPVVRHIFRRCMASTYLALDSTGMPVLDDEVPEGIRRGTLWHLLGDGRWAYFGYAPSGHDHHLEALADGAAFEAMMSDGSPTHNVLERGPGRVRAGCHSHARAKLAAAVRAGDPRAVEGLRLYAPLFVIEAQSKAARETAAGRRTRRRAQSRAHWDALGAWVEARLGDVEPKSPLGKAVRYMHRQWPRLSRFLEDGRIDLTNNEVERDLRTWVLDRKTWLFCGHEQSAGRAAAAMTVIVTCAKFGIDPRRYVRDVIRALLAGEKDLSKLLPENYVPSG
jgi:transposase